MTHPLDPEPDRRHRKGYAPQSPHVQTKIRPGAQETAMSHHIANRLDTDAASEQAHGKRVSQLIHVDRRRKARLASSLLEDVLHSSALDRTARAARTQKELGVCSPLLVTAVNQVLAQHAERRRGERKLQDRK